MTLSHPSEPSFLGPVKRGREGGRSGRGRGVDKGGGEGRKKPAVFPRVEEIEKSELKDGPMRKKRVSPSLLSPPLLEYLI